MRARIVFPIVASLLAFSHAASAQTLTGAAKWADSARREIEVAYMEGAVARLADVRTMLGRALVAFPDDALLLHYQGYAIYRSLNLLSMTKTAGELAALNDSARIYLERSVSKKPMPETYALLTAVYGRQITADPSLGQTVGMEIQRVAMEARSLGPANPRVLLLAGQGAMFTPAEWGGGAEPAQKLFSKAIELFANDAPAAPLPAWGRAEVYAWLGQVYEKLGRRADALTAYQKAIEIEPGYSWVRRVLIPAVSK